MNEKHQLYSALDKGTIFTAIYKSPGEKLTNGKKSQEGDLCPAFVDSNTGRRLTHGQLPSRENKFITMRKGETVTEDSIEGQSVLSKSPDFSVQSL